MYQPFDPDTLNLTRVAIYDFDVPLATIRYATARAAYGKTTKGEITIMLDSDGIESIEQAIAAWYVDHPATTRHENINPTEIGSSVCIEYLTRWRDMSVRVVCYAPTGSDLAVALGFPVAKGEERFDDGGMTNPDDFRV